MMPIPETEENDTKKIEKSPSLDSSFQVIDLSKDIYVNQSTDDNKQECNTNQSKAKFNFLDESESKKKSLELVNDSQTLKRRKKTSFVEEYLDFSQRTTIHGLQHTGEENANGRRK